MNITPDMATELDLAPLDWLLGQWEAPGGFREPSGCTRRLVVRHSLGGRFIEIDAENMWPTVAGGADRFPERLLLQTGEGGFVGVRFDSRGGMGRVGFCALLERQTDLLERSP